MILIADSGSSKTAWCLLDKEQGRSEPTIFTAGINPYFQSPKEIDTAIRESLCPAIAGYPVEAIYFYGAGCAFGEQHRMVAEALQRHIPAAVEVHSDLMGAARALCGQEPGIACILGTGSNSCLFDGTDIREQVSPLGFILGDEGSGAVLGKTLVSDALKRQLPEPIVRKFMQQYELTPATVLERVYRQPFPNRFLATLSPFLLENITEEPIRELVFSNFQRFFIRNVMSYEGHLSYPVHFTGSIAYYYREVLKEAAVSLHLRIGTIEQSPIPGLIAYHTQTN